MVSASLPTSSEKVPLRVRIGWGMGGLADNYIVNTLNTLGLIIYVTYFKLDPTLAGIAMFIPRFIDAIFDPLIGHLSDNTRSRFGRRRPYMVVGAILSAVLLPLLWTPPYVATATEPWFRNIPFLYFAIMGTIYSLAYTLFVVPYTALGYELTNDYDERTRVLAWRMYIGLAGCMTVPWIYRLCLLHWFPNEAVGARCISLVLSVIIIVTGLQPVFACRERQDVRKMETIPMLAAIRYTFTNRPFLILSVAYIIIVIGLFSAGNLFSFINIYYVCRGDKAFAGDIGGYSGLAASISAYASMFLITAISVRWSKRTAMNIGLLINLVSTIGAWFTLDPRWPYLQLVTVVISALGLQGCWLMINSMIADICDQDELLSGSRQEGMFGAVNGFCQKLAMAITSLIGGMLLNYSGFNPASADTAGVSLHTALTMKALIIGLQASGFVVALVIFLFYPITREMAAATRRALELRHQQLAAKTDDDGDAPPPALPGAAPDIATT